ncbi:MAG TPA: DUF1707 domain-containing protein, partial [Arachnia sp.]|nr:DUF1707 domain-containing protein [Arachnia sp.]
MSDANVPENRMRAGDQERDDVLVALQRAYEAGRLDLDEMHERQDQALRAKFADELGPLLADLPEGQELATRPDATPTPAHKALPAVAPADAGFSMTVMSGRDVVVESGTETLSDFSWWGGNNYDVTRAMGPGRVLTLNLHAVMAGSDIFVPAGVRVVEIGQYTVAPLASRHLGALGADVIKIEDPQGGDRQR